YPCLCNLSLRGPESFGNDIRRILTMRRSRLPPALPIISLIGVIVLAIIKPTYANIWAAGVLGVIAIIWAVLAFKTRSRQGQCIKYVVTNLFVARVFNPCRPARHGLKTRATRKRQMLTMMDRKTTE